MRCAERMPPDCLGRSHAVIAALQAFANYNESHMRGKLFDSLPLLFGLFGWEFGEATSRAPARALMLRCFAKWPNPIVGKSYSWKEYSNCLQEPWGMGCPSIP